MRIMSAGWGSTAWARACSAPLGEFSQQTIREAFLKEGVNPGTVPEKQGEAPKIPGRPPMMCAGCPHRGMFYTLAKNHITVLGDIGCYTLGAVAPLNALDSTLCMGASVSGIHGFNLARGKETEKKTVAVIGDSTFMHSGMTGLVNIAYNATNSTVIILDNSITGMTGHQQNPTTGYNIKGDPAAKVDLEALCRALGIRRVRVVDPYNLKECEQAVKEELAAEEPSVIISRRPCVLLKYVKARRASAGESGQMPRLQALHGHGMPRDLHEGREGPHRPDPLRGLRRVFPALSLRCHRGGRNKRMKTTSIMIVGVGGQGSLLASKLLGNLLTEEGYDVKVSEVHGMSQRGGSVVTYVRYGQKVYSPIVTEGECDFIISFEKLEGARYANCLKKGGKIIVNTQEIDPMPVITGSAEYPGNVLEELKNQGFDIDDFDALTPAMEAGSAKAVNIVLMGHFAGIPASRRKNGRRRWSRRCRPDSWR